MAGSREGTACEVSQYWDSRDQLSVLDGIIYKGLRIVIPPSLREQMVNLIHRCHLGMVKCKQRAWEVMFWLCMNKDIEHCINSCNLRATYQKQQEAEPLRPTPTPDLPYMPLLDVIFLTISLKSIFYWLIIIASSLMWYS